ncbi:MAG TPA: hypothetical protein IAA20_02385 [Candidatus Enterococcus avicola]|uniref:Uncharacterized protein n=1 Tax=Candidatus Enterococcus avicola TaxID=2838561 RepID=A0A9D2F5A1_9ENTE|nr:hypothetical protein [Weissella thailandensis]HIZ52774.1 hypothetical protein [Candidatus Enterococcus avicola]HJA22849.1 hypothetical protein [Candidatus Limosilactobacillus intestinavium]
MTEKNAQTEANKRWQTKNKEHAKYLQYRTYARSFIRKLATDDDLDELEQLIKERREQDIHDYMDRFKPLMDDLKDK